MTPEDLAAIRARCDAATEGPWETEGGFLYHHGTNLDDGYQGDFEPNDATFIAACRTDVPALLAEVERLRAENERHVEREQRWQLLWLPRLQRWAARWKAGAKARRNGSHQCWFCAN